MPESCVPVTIVTGRGLIIVRLQDFRYGQMVALFGSPLVCKQWGKFLPANDGWTSGQVNFPITFGSACLAVNVSVVMGDDKNDFESAVYHSPGLTSFSVYYSARRTRPIFWIAIGY